MTFSHSLLPYFYFLVICLLCVNARKSLSFAKRLRQGGGGGSGRGHERRARKRTGWKVHIESKTQVCWLTSVLAIDVHENALTAQTEVSQHTCVFDSMWTFQPVRFRARLSWPRPLSLPPPPPPSFSLSLSLSFPFLTKPFGERQTFSCIDTQQTNDQIYVVARIFCCTFQCWRSCCEAVDAALYPTPLLFDPFFFSTKRCTPALLLSSLPFPFPPYPHHRETCAGLFMLFLWHFHPRSEARSRRVGTGGEAGVTDELKSTRLVLNLAPWRGSSLVSMAISCVHWRAKRQTSRA